MSDQIRRIDDSVELLMFADGMILVDAHDVLLTSAIRFGEKDGETIVVLQFAGRVNHSDERRTVNVAFRPKDAFGLSGSILDVIERAIQHDEGDRP